MAVAVAAIAAAAAVVVLGELLGAEAFIDEPLAAVSYISMSSASRQSELDVVAVFPPSASTSLFAEVDAFLSFSDTLLGRL